METYKNLNKDSGIAQFKLGETYIDIKFKGKAEIYRYTNAETGKEHIETLKSLALKGKGLATYISQHPEVRDNYSFTIKKEME